MLVLIFLTFVLCAFAAPLIRSVAPAGVPSYVLQYAPIVYLYSTETHLPSDIGSQLTHTQPEVNFTTIENGPKPLTLDNLNALNSIGGDWSYLTSLDDVTTHPAWLNGVKPDSTGKTNGAVSSAIIVNDHGSGLVDVFYFYFYAFDYGGTYVGNVVGSHVGDWEHNMMRFKNGVPQAVWYSQHQNGEAFTYATVNKYKGGSRPITYSAVGSHANYATTGTHGHDIPDVNLPFGLLHDYTDQGPLWDPTLSAYYYTYDANTQKFGSYDDTTPVNWLYYIGHWGDKQYPNSDPRQHTILGISALAQFQDGPTGPEDKYLNRTNVCPPDGILCIVRPILGP